MDYLNVFLLSILVILYSAVAIKMWIGIRDSKRKIDQLLLGRQKIMDAFFDKLKIATCESLIDNAVKEERFEEAERLRKIMEEEKLKQTK